MPRTLFISFGLVSAMSLLGCSSTDPPDSGAANCSDFSQLPTSPTISFQGDIIPIFGLGCASSSSCHEQSGHKAGLVLGDPSSFGPGKSTCFDSTAKWGCTIPTPVDPALRKTILDNIVGFASTTNPALQRIVPLKPESSFLLDKATGQENKKQYPGQCTNQDPSRGGGTCGGDMPDGTPGGLCADASGQQKVQAIAMWVLQGAQDN